ncbi:hypothetical protein PCC9214_00688 [Planktothrix tepida]|uniref:Uncharacterized protein n=1 Tax=Planktothrix tepida PCC 9214 TaxID=671072 RepID=A0A1J1LGF2_9CYAN|nr:hypothetical protein [Planktothrix tepida]CAD5921495.1 hypothetical protein PCC9214_00688 [Planktothrix tepida]CUR30980.1 conserved hypothetical protein [Planktothrix tepida PCC 9214]
MVKPRKPQKQRGLSFLLVAFSITLLIILGGFFDSLEMQGLAQTPPEQTTSPSGRVRVSEIWKKVYEQLPNLPLENQYISQETGKVAEDNTLIGRLIRYHVYVKARPTQYRLDWKLTLADYLGVNEPMLVLDYPGRETLKENPLERDQKAIQQLNRAERDALVNTLVRLFNPNATNIDNPTIPKPNSSSTTPKTPPGLTPLPQSGDAELLK